MSKQEERERNKPTHSDIGKMLRDIYKYSQQNPKFEIGACDSPCDLLVGYIVYGQKGGKETARHFYIRLTDLKNLPKRFSLILDPNGRRKLCNKEILRKLIETEEK